MHGGNLTSRFLKTDGTVLVAGSNFLGNLGVEGQETVTTPVEVLSGVMIQTSTWAGYEIDADGVSVNTGDFLGWIDISADPYVYVYSLDTYVYLPESAVADSGSWMWIYN